jgi:hypothetical protein
MVRAGFADGDEAACEHQARARELTRLNGATDIELQLVPTAEVAQGCDAGSQIPAGVLEHLEGHRTVGRLLEAAVGLATAGEMNMTIDQAGHYVLAAEIEVDDVLFERGLPLARLAGIDDLPLANADGGIGDGFAACAINEGNVLECKQGFHGGNHHRRLRHFGVRM